MKGGELPQDTLNSSGIKIPCRVPAQMNKLGSYSAESCGFFSRTNINITNTYTNTWHLDAYKWIKCKDLFSLLSEAASYAHYAEVPEDISAAAHIRLISIETRRCKETRTVYFLLFI